MTIVEERAEFFSQWRGGLREENYTLCENSMNFLLTSLDESSESWINLSNKYNDGLVALIKELGDIKDQYRKDKRLSKGFTAAALQDERRRKFWMELYDLFYKEFKKKSLISQTK
jgi:hypothetical protein